MLRALVTSLALSVVCATAGAQSLSLTLPPSGDNQKSSVTQHIGLVSVTVDYSSPDVHLPNGTDRRGKIYGTDVVPYGLTNLGFGTCGDQCPWRAGANDNTVVTVSHDVKVEGQALPAGRYGLHMIPSQNDDWTIIFSKNTSAWGSYTYSQAEDALRVKVKPSKSEYNEFLTYEFTERFPDRTTVAMKWEDLQVPIRISVDNPQDLYIANLRGELRNYAGFNWQHWDTAARYALNAQRPAAALEFAERATSFPGIGVETFQTLSTLADAQEATGKTAESKATRDRALNHETADVRTIHQYGRQLLAQGKKEEALRVWELNAKRHPKQWPVNVGLARGYSAVGRYKDALKHAKLAAAEAPDAVNKKSMADAVAKLEKGQDIN